MESGWLLLRPLQIELAPLRIAFCHQSFSKGKLMKLADRPLYLLHLELLEDLNLPNNLLGLGSALVPGLANLGIPAFDFASLLQESQLPANPIASHGGSGNTTSADPAEVGTL